MQKPEKCSKSARRRSEGVQQEAREMIRGVLPLRLSYSEVTVDEPTIKRREEEESGEKEAASSERLYTKPQERLRCISLPLYVSSLSPFLSISLQ